MSPTIEENTMPQRDRPEADVTDKAVFRAWTSARRELGEGLRWVGDRLVTVDILAGTLTALDTRTPGDGRELARLDVPLGAVAPVAGRPGTWLAAAGTGVALLGPDGTVAWIDRPEDGNPVAMRVNDGVCDPAGRFWFGTMPYDGTAGAGSLYRVDADGGVTRVLDGLTVPNGPAFTADGTTLYLADSARGLIDRFAVDPTTGTPADRRPFVRLPADAGSPDGMTVDDAGHLWVALWGGAAVHRYTPDGTLDRRLRVPADQPTSPALHDGRLFVATAAHGLDAPRDHDGRVLAAPVGISAPEAVAAIIT
ncbi:SMP-30/gluconolactonase/LRE family protein [Yinghuangia sp. ASG 101]|uniref:SMP-30/gluconolactonase/LRE family protein n=1 Tax=Yinghuangia sp. ASG 101 TaxID=2896848 RepID=UPI001E3EE99A|nr:SMP-30/gluconolactonase/LRE family protein [Yinghuangia sp. ASG 101]UGQ09242.1 SMP-30/gluconolactonase/LRE family protein [Yinghuangia sp. ASG 101]